MPVRQRLAVRAADDGAGVEVEVLTGGRARVPAEADGDAGQAGCLLGERHVAALGEADSHGFLQVVGGVPVAVIEPISVRSRTPADGAALREESVPCPSARGA